MKPLAPGVARPRGGVVPGTTYYYRAVANLNLGKYEEAISDFEKGKTFVEVETGPQTFSRREVKLGLSDGINVEIVSGIAEGARVKIPAGEASSDPKPKKP